MTMLNTLLAGGVSFMKTAAEYWAMADQMGARGTNERSSGPPTCSSLKSGLTQLLNLIGEIVVVGLVWQS